MYNNLLNTTIPFTHPFLFNQRSNLINILNQWIEIGMDRITAYIM